MLINEISVVDGLEDFNESHKILTIFNLGESLYLIHGKFFQLGNNFEILDINCFDCKYLISSFVDCVVNITE
jgi:hypothetical protein